MCQDHKYLTTLLYLLPREGENNNERLWHKWQIVKKLRKDGSPLERVDTVFLNTGPNTMVPTINLISNLLLVIKFHFFSDEKHWLVRSIIDFEGSLYIELVEIWGMYCNVIHSHVATLINICTRSQIIEFYYSLMCHTLCIWCGMFSELVFLSTRCLWHNSYQHGAWAWLWHRYHAHWCISTGWCHCPFKV